MFPAPTRATLRTALRVLVLPSLAIALCTGGARAETVTQQFSGTVTAVSDTTNGRVDLTGVFTVGMSFTASYTIDLATPPTYADLEEAQYAQLVTAFSFALGGYSGSATLPHSGATVYNDVPDYGGAGSDGYVIDSQAPTTLPVFGASVMEVATGLSDLDGTAFQSTALPRLLPDLAGFETKGATFYVRPGGSGNFGIVTCSLTGGTTPARAASWGSVKGRYRE